MAIHVDIAPAFLAAFKHAMKQDKDLSLKDLAAKIDVNYSWLSQIHTGRRSCSESLRRRIIQGLGYSDYDSFLEFGQRLLDGQNPAEAGINFAGGEVKGSMLGSDRPELKIVVNVNKKGDKESVDLHGDHYVGVPIRWDNKLLPGSGGFVFDETVKPQGTFIVHAPELKDRSHHLLYALRIESDNMYPTIPPGSLAIIDCSDRRLKNHAVFAVQTLNEQGEHVAAIFRILEAGGGFALLSDNMGSHHPRNSAH